MWSKVLFSLLLYFHWLEQGKHNINFYKYFLNKQKLSISNSVLLVRQDVHLSYYFNKASNDIELTTILDVCPLKIPQALTHKYLLIFCIKGER